MVQFLVKDQRTISYRLEQSEEIYIQEWFSDMLRDRKIGVTPCQLAKLDKEDHKQWTPKYSLNKCQQQESHNFWLKKENSIENVDHTVSHPEKIWGQRFQLGV